MFRQTQPRQMRSFRLDQTSIDQLKALSSQLGASQGELIEQLVNACYDSACVGFDVQGFEGFVKRCRAIKKEIQARQKPDMAIIESKDKKILTYENICQAVNEIAPRYGIEQMYIFGSYARGDATEESDVDFRIVGGHFPTLFEIGGLYEDLMQSLGRKVDVVMSKNMNANQEFRDRIRDDEVLVYG